MESFLIAFLAAFIFLSPRFLGWLQSRLEARRQRILGIELVSSIDDIACLIRLSTIGRLSVSFSPSDSSSLTLAIYSLRQYPNHRNEDELNEVRVEKDADVSAALVSLFSKICTATIKDLTEDWRLSSRGPFCITFMRDWVRSSPLPTKEDGVTIVLEFRHPYLFSSGSLYGRSLCEVWICERAQDGYTKRWLYESSAPDLDTAIIRTFYNLQRRKVQRRLDDWKAS